ncbi:MAG TPA: PfkB family carbohydrate kinase [Candidatus Limnocylindrales bacterium]|jgi:fructokinase
MKKPRIVCIGDLMLDVVVRASADVELGTDVPGSVRFRLGGSAGNTCRAFVDLGGKAALVCAAGNDSLSGRLIAAHRASHVSVHAIRTAGPTPRLAVLVSARGERSFVTERGVADSLAVSSFKPSWFARANVLHLPAYSLLKLPASEACVHASRLVRRRGGLVSVDLASRAPLLAAGADMSLAAVRAVGPDILFANRDEVAALVGRGGARRLLGVAPVVVVKLGQGGCRVLWRGAAQRSVAEIEVATKPLLATDTTGAGDAFDAGFLYSLAISGFIVGAPSAPVLRRAALSGHRTAARVLSSPRQELDL